MRAALATLATAFAAVACGSSTPSSDTPWAPSHPDPQGIHFAAAQGLCLVTVRYPADAPGEIDAAGGVYIQRTRGSAPPSPGSRLATSGDWTLYRRDPHTLILVTPQGAYTYQDGANCGSNSAAPT
jgi:hypothetical protein